MTAPQALLSNAPQGRNQEGGVMHRRMPGPGGDWLTGLDASSVAKYLSQDRGLQCEFHV